MPVARTRSAKKSSTRRTRKTATKAEKEVDRLQVLVRQLPRPLFDKIRSTPEAWREVGPKGLWDHVKSEFPQLDDDAANRMCYALSWLTSVVGLRVLIEFDDAAEHFGEDVTDSLLEPIFEVIHQRRNELEEIQADFESETEVE